MVLANLLRRAWWAERVKDTWRRGSAEAVAQPRLARIARTLRSPTAVDRDADEAWTLAEGSMATWQKTLRGDSLQDVLGAVLEYTVAQGRQLHSETYRFRAHAEVGEAAEPNAVAGRHSRHAVAGQGH